MHPETVVDVVFSDIEMPGFVDGFGLAKWIREHRPGPAVLFVPRKDEKPPPPTNYLFCKGKSSLWRMQ